MKMIVVWMIIISLSHNPKDDVFFKQFFTNKTECELAARILEDTRFTNKVVCLESAVFIPGDF